MDTMMVSILLYLEVTYTLLCGLGSAPPDQLGHLMQLVTMPRQKSDLEPEPTQFPNANSLLIAI